MENRIYDHHILEQNDSYLNCMQKLTQLIDQLNIIIVISIEMRPFLKTIQNTFKNRYRNSYPTALTLTNRYKFANKHPKNLDKHEQPKHWHIQRTESMIKDLQIIYNNKKMEKGEMSRVAMQCELSLSQSKQLIEGQLKSFKTILWQNKAQLQKLLSQIALSVQNIIQGLDMVILSINKFCQKSSSMSLHEVHAKSNILSYIFKQLFQDKAKLTKQTLFNKLTYILQVQIRLKSSLIFLDIYTPDERNITNSHPSLFPQVWKHIQIETYDSHQINNNYREIQKTIHASIGAIQQSQKSKNALMKSLSFGYYFPINYVKYELGLLSSLHLYRTGDLQKYKKFLNLYEQGLIKHITTYYFPKITTNTLMYIPTEDKDMDSLDLFKENKESICVRVLYHKNLPIISKGSKIDQEIEDIIIHMHGGGFVGLSSHTTQNYTRPWANQLKMPIFSIDYRMPPTHPYPYAPNDCFQVYKFLTGHLHKYMRIRPKNIYICGDSAGGNLSCALTALVMKNKLLKPKGLFLAYPCLDTRLVYYPSRKFIIDDPLLWPSAAILFFNAYATRDEEKSHPIASPLLLSQQFIGGAKGDSRFPLGWPTTYITIGSKDFLRDQCLLFMQKMVESNIPCKCFLFQHLRHAFFSTEKIMKQSKEAFQLSISAFKQMVARTKKEQL